MINKSIKFLALLFLTFNVYAGGDDRDQVYYENLDEELAAFEAQLAEDLAKAEGIFAGNSCGAAIKGLLQLKDKLKKTDVVVVLLHDSGSRYIGKIYNDIWMKSKKFLT